LRSVESSKKNSAKTTTKTTAGGGVVLKRKGPVRPSANGSSTRRQQQNLQDQNGSLTRRHQGEQQQKNGSSLTRRQQQQDLNNNNNIKRRIVDDNKTSIDRTDSSLLNRMVDDEATKRRNLHRNRKKNGDVHHLNQQHQLQNEIKNDEIGDYLINSSRGSGVRGGGKRELAQHYYQYLHQQQPQKRQIDLPQISSRQIGSNHRNMEFDTNSYHNNSLIAPSSVIARPNTSRASSTTYPMVNNQIQSNPIDRKSSSRQSYWNTTKINKSFSLMREQQPQDIDRANFRGHQFYRNLTLDADSHHDDASHPWRSALTSRLDDRRSPNMSYDVTAMMAGGVGSRLPSTYAISTSNSNQHLQQHSLTRRSQHNIINPPLTMRNTSGIKSNIRWNVIDLYATKRNNVDHFQMLCSHPSKLKESITLFLDEKLIRSSNLFGNNVVDGWKKKDLLQSVITSIESDPARAFSCSRFIESFVALILWILNGTKVTNIISACIHSLGSLSIILLKADLIGWPDNILYGIGVTLSQKMLQFSKVNNTSTNVIFSECINSLVRVAEASDNVNVLILSMHHYLKEVVVNRNMDHSFITKLFSLMANFINDDIIQRYMGHHNQDIVFSELNMIAKFMEDPLPQSVSMQALNYLYRIFTIFEDAHNSFFTRQLRLFEDGALLEFCLNLGSAHGITHSVDNTDNSHPDVMDPYDDSSYIRDQIHGSLDNEYHHLHSTNNGKMNGGGGIGTHSISSNEHYFTALPPTPSSDISSKLHNPTIVGSSTPLMPSIISRSDGSLQTEEDEKLSPFSSINTVEDDLIVEMRIIECIRCLDLLKLLWQNYPQAIKVTTESISYLISCFESEQEMTTVELINKWEPCESEELLSDLLNTIEKSCEKLLKAKSKTSKSKFLESFLENFLQIEKLAIRLLNRINSSVK